MHQLFGGSYYENDEPLKAQEFAQRLQEEDCKKLFEVILCIIVIFNKQSFYAALIDS